MSVLYTLFCSICSLTWEAFKSLSKFGLFVGKFEIPIMIKEVHLFAVSLVRNIINVFLCFNITL